MSRRFDHFLAIDWSGAKGARHKGIALAIADADGGPPVLVDAPKRGWSREDVLAILRDDLPANTLVGMDLGIALPFADCGAFFPGWEDSPPDAKSLWALIDAICAGEPHLGSGPFVDHPDIAPFYRRHNGREGARFRCDGAFHGRGRFRVAEQVQAAMGCRPYSNFNLVGAAQVGKSSLTGMRVLHRLAGTLPVWPIDPLPETGSAIVEIYTTIAAMAAGRGVSASKIRDREQLDAALAQLGSEGLGGTGPVDDHSSDALLTAAWLRAVAHDTAIWQPPALTPEVARTEGWTFGAI
ncbi:hypothetical protein [Paraurantiacibacter namhicola]|uniref:DUF429 domain-containing protein n=1 Tax=Paraurantiacibacter namhicola TaxID=645517 RepID=A0A1C7DAS1_9SPHN|nr:hypothetical protein [Paraurantiacibacter namhicola]ANU08517.1 hypothetical protein A6F65_02233 [Paraurantiacibacter namhicola]